MTKKIVAFLFCIGIFLAIASTPIAYARFTHLKSVTMHMNRSNNVITSTTRIEGQPGTTRITALYVLEILENGNYRQVGYSVSF